MGLSARPVGLVTNAGAGVRVELGHLVSEELEEDLVSEVFSVQPERERPFEALHCFVGSVSACNKQSRSPSRPCACPWWRAFHACMSHVI